MNEEFESLRNRINAADPAKDVSSLNESVVARAALSGGARAPWSARARKLVFSGSALASAGAFALVLSLAIPQQPLIQMAANSPASKMSAAGSPAASDQGLESARMIWPGFIEYDIDASELSSETGNGRVYQLELSGDPRAILLELADYFKVSGEVREEEWSSAEFPTFGIGTPERQVGITWAGTGGFFFNSYDENSYRCEKKTVELENGESYETCEPIYTPELIPSEAEIKSQALAIFTRFGLEISESEIRVDRQQWGASAAGAMRINGQETALEWWVNFDASGRLSNVYGHFAKPADRGNFKTVSAKDAAERIKDGRWMGSPPSSAWNQQLVGVSARAQSEPAVEPMPVAPDTKDVTTEPGEPVEPKVQIVKLKLNSAQPQLLMIYDKSGGAWLVPGYLLQNDQGWFHAVISLEEGVIQLPDPVQFGIMPIERDSGTGQD